MGICFFDRIIVGIIQDLPQARGAFTACVGNGDAGSDRIGVAGRIKELPGALKVGFLPGKEGFHTAALGDSCRI